MLQEHPTVRLHLGVLSLALSLVTGGCGTDEAAPPVTAEPPRIELGAGRVDFVPIPPDGSVEIVSGPQGGFHLELTVRLFHLDPEGLVLDYDVSDAETGALLSFAAQYAISADRVLDRGDHLLRVGDRAVLVVPSAEAARGRVASITCRAVHGEVVTAEDAREVTLVDEVDELGP
ncbi:hypothetical protein [Polyangium jinanense]|uniref:Uncharacterized protein n=1 Tax=Polyangium jinanense TaxID=2829994 RepID=A0A9X4AUG5_9BACT|nr:hypothetical protein [Polyangium jinanense]MDC3958800.1 hypothetical protein [Polyangium jinanense]MDC3985219.1 hypothetical protein [Polyangium jinanense]